MQLVSVNGRLSSVVSEENVIKSCRCLLVHVLLFNGRLFFPDDLSETVDSKDSGKVSNSTMTRKSQDKEGNSSLRDGSV